ncbi:phosphoribosylamine--glycine ligase [Candidatus Uabimicrobium sp. HlEnr_7]|uniref:phosphoribosylamine--glycine ligase n=1 Tax=Candidatus Uabimicrobium helgolandensis TaxID=3095367 RepID=UPI00355669FB
MAKNKNLKVLVIGGGILEHSLVRKLKQSPKVSKIYVAPGNEGMRDIAECLDIPETDYFQIIKFAKEQKIDLTLVGPYRLIADGIADQFHKEKLRIFAPRARQAEIGASRVVAKELMRHYSIPTSPYHVFENIDGVMNFCEHARFPLVIKIEGTALAGTVVCHSMEHVVSHLDKVMKKKVFGEAGERLIIENFIHGDVISMTILIDRQTIIPFPACQIVREFIDGNRYPIKLGAFSPVHCISPRMIHHIEREIIVPLVHAINRQYHSYKGFLTVDMVITEKGARVLDFKIQWSDILAQVLLNVYQGDFVDLVLHTLNGTLENLNVEWCTKSVAGLVAVKDNQIKSTGGYVKLPSFPIDEDEHTKVFCGKTKRMRDNVWGTGERILGLVSTGKTVNHAYKNMEESVSYIDLKEDIVFRIPQITNKGKNIK